IALRTAPDLSGLFRFNQFALQVEFTRSPPWRDIGGMRCTDRDHTQLMAWLQSHDIRVRNAGAVGDCVAVVAQENATHPVCDYLNAVKWDGVPRLQIWLVEYLNATGDLQYLGAV